MISFSAIQILRVAATVMHSIALISTAYRLVYRIRARRFSWDDGWALMAFVADIMALVVLWIYAYLNDNYALLPETRNRRAIVSRLMSTSFMCEIWFARLSLALTFINMLPKGRIKRGSLLFTILFTLFWIAIFAQKMSVCNGNLPNVPTPYKFQCSIGKVEGILEIVADTASCVLLVLIGAYILWQMELRSKERLRIMFLFSGSIFTVMSASARSYSILATEDMLRAFMGHFEAAISLIVCNVVVLAGIYSMLYRSSHSVRNDARTTLEHSATKKDSHPVDKNILAPDRPSEANTIMSFTEIDSFESPQHPTIHSNSSHSLHHPYSHTNSSSHSLSLCSPENGLYQCEVGEAKVERTSTASGSQEFVYLTDSEPCSGSVIIVLDAIDSESNRSSV